MNDTETIKRAMKWSNGDPEECAEIALYLDQLYENAYVNGFAAGFAANNRILNDQQNTRSPSRHP